MKVTMCVEARFKDANIQRMEEIIRSSLRSHDCRDDLDKFLVEKLLETLKVAYDSGGW